MRAHKAARVAIAAVALCLGCQAQAQAQPVASAPATSYITYTEDAPCPPDARRDSSHRRARRPVRHVGRRLRSPSSVKKARVVPVAHTKKRMVVRVKSHPRHRSAPRLVRVVAPVHHRRCAVVRRDPLTRAAFGIAPADAITQPASYDLSPGGPFSDVSPSSGRAAFGDPVGGGAGGGGSDVGAPGSSGGGPIVSAAPEPEGWVLMILGVALVGAMMRRSRRSVRQPTVS